MTDFEGPRPVDPEDALAEFHCGNQSLDGWLGERALAAERARTARTYIVTDNVTGRVAGYYCLSASSVARGEVGGGWLARNVPDPIPVILLGRLAVDLRYQGEGLGAALLKSALRKAVAAASVIGSRALLVDAADEQAVDFYVHFGFRRLPAKPSTLFLPTDRLG